MQMNIKGNAWKFGSDISTDLIAPGRYFHLRENLPELAKHVLEDARTDFAGNVKEGDFIAADRNFGLGSSREHAAQIIKIVGVKVILAKSFARIFYRNAINLGLVALECDTDLIDEGDELELNLKDGMIKDLTKGIEIKTAPMPEIMLLILKEGGLLPYIKKHGDLPIV